MEDRWISTASLRSTVEVAEVVQGVDLDPTTPRYSSRDGADTSGDPAGGTLGKDCGDARPFIAGIS